MCVPIYNERSSLRTIQTAKAEGFQAETFVSMSFMKTGVGPKTVHNPWKNGFVLVIFCLLENISGDCLLLEQVCITFVHVPGKHLVIMHFLS